MNKIQVAESRLINATPDKVYGVISDYHVGHPAILPKRYFKECVIEQGGKGAGTVVRVRMEVMGVTEHYRLTVTEPEPGRVMVEEDPDKKTVTTFTVEPVGDQTKITFLTETTFEPGIGGWIKTWMNPPIMRRVYREELQQLADYVEQK